MLDTIRRQFSLPRTRPEVEDNEILLEALAIGAVAGGERLLSGIDLRIKRGRRIVIVGPNGAGKSLLLRILHGLVSPSEGRILWRGRAPDKQAKKFQAMVFQRPVLLRRSVLANMTFALSVRGLRGREGKARAMTALAEAGLDHLAHRPARVLSGGEQQRLAVARALAGKPDILFLDEPTASLDPASTIAIEELVRSANRAGTTTVLVTHDAGQARRMGDDLIFLQDGRIVETGAVAEVLETPQSEQVRAWRDGRLYVCSNALPGVPLKLVR